MKPDTSSVVTRERLIDDFKRIGLSEGDTVAVTLSLKSIGYIEGGADTFIDALLQAVGAQGTIMMNAYTQSFPASEIQSNYVFDPKTTPPYTGVAPKMLLKRKAAVRSLHPTCSVVALGKNAHYLTQSHNEKARPYMPYSLLAQINGKYLSIGNGNNLVAIRHEAQYNAGLPRFLRSGVQYRNVQGEIGLFVWEHAPCEKNLHRLVPRLDRLGFMQHGKIGGADAVLMVASDFLENQSAMLRADPALNSCGDILCVQCRETERKMNLRNFAEPRFFQRSLLMRKVLQMRNHMVIMRNSRALVRDKDSGLFCRLDYGFQVSAKKLAQILK
ncbi:MAG: AAC(3) family N-acetyltransferase [Candidatus Bathyarchaeota archaeon]|nr:AAC(3) family N-acetyltransferase [Candidatus Bathyarchaeota archaeon]